MCDKMAGKEMDVFPLVATDGVVPSHKMIRQRIDRSVI